MCQTQAKSTLSGKLSGASATQTSPSFAAQKLSMSSSS